MKNKINPVQTLKQTSKAGKLLVLSLSIAALGLTGCGLDSDSASDSAGASGSSISGVAATGAAFVGEVQAVNKNGQVFGPVEIGAGGNYSINVEGEGPFLIKAYNDSGVTLYSYAPSADTVNTNITQLTTIAVMDANGYGRDLSELFSGWAELLENATNEEKLDEIEGSLLDSAAQVIANLSEEFVEAGFTSSQYSALNVFTYEFEANSTGFDSVLDDVTFSYTCSTEGCTASYTVDGASFEWNYNISTDGINLSFDPVDVVVDPELPIGNGNFDLRITTSAAGTNTVTTINGVDKPATQSEFCAAEQAELPDTYQINSCSFKGDSGNISATVSASGFSINYSISYEYIARV